MYNGLLHLHSVVRWIILILLLIVLYRAIVDRNQPFTAGHRKLGLALMITCDIALLIGIYQWLTGPWGLKSIQANGMSVVMKNATLRFFAVEHLVGMLTAIVLVHLGYAASKKPIPDRVKHKRTLILYGLALLIILVFVPWPFRTAGAGRHWIPGL
jgi:hypothetical protein